MAEGTPVRITRDHWGFLCGAIMALGASLSFASARAGILGGRGTWQRGQGEQCDGKAGDRQRSRHGRVRNPWVAVWLLYRDRRRRRGISQSGQYSPRPLDC